MNIKTLLIIVLVVALPVSAALYQRNNAEEVNPAEYGLVMCERDKQLGSVHATKEKICCINTDLSQFCGNDEPIVATCESNLCVFPTRTFKAAWTYWFRRTPCYGMAVLTGDENEQLMKSQKCEKDGEYWCCSPYAFPPPIDVLKPKPGMKSPTEPNPEGALLIIVPEKWQAMEFGYDLRDKYSMRAFKAEKERCRKGGSDVKIIDGKYGSYFTDTRNIKPNVRSFYMMPDEVIPLISWC